MLDKFYPIVPDITWLEKIVPLGVKTVQLRLKNADTAQIKKQIISSIKICKEYHCQLIINDYWKEAIELGANYIHLGQEDLAKANLSEIKSAGLKLGLSTHDHHELEIAINAEPDYIALGPIYETKLKKMKWSPQGLERITEWKSMLSCPLVAIGGITLERAPMVFEAGADSIAVVTDIITHPKPEERIKNWLLI